ncbi:MAG: hypothetical protein LWW88_00205 [Acinetobacter sp.]|uniref:hypothetical protein n=1 Tax=Acinetobacter sp. TaxID=472 RepID=UPI00258ABC27|nr:hypothetical protein [Acinetobacter sp.]MCE1270001.1 hypothetical protein [Acinetobacter sp.]
MALNLTPEQQEIFDRVVGIITQNDELRNQFKTAVEEVNKHPMADDANYMSDSNDEVIVNYRKVANEVREEVKEVVPNLKADDSWLFSKICIAICHNFIDTK